jgi:Tol biopolymer transport system component
MPIGASGELLYVTVDGTLTLLRIGASPGPEATVLKEGLQPDTSWAWSPDGQAYALAIPCPGGEAHDILAYSVKSGELLHEIRGFSTCGFGTIEWPAKGRLFSLDSGTGFGRQLDLFRLGQPDRVASIGYQGWYRWSPDAEMLAYCQPRAIESPNPWELTESGGSGDLAVYLVETGETTTLFEGTAEYMYYPMAWLAVDRLLVGRLASDPEAPSRIAYFECGLDQPRELLPVEALPPHLDRKFMASLLPVALQDSARRTGSYAWTADLSYVAVALQAEVGRFEIWVMSADGTEVCKVADDAVGGEKPLWRPR